MKRTERNRYVSGRNIGLGSVLSVSAVRCEEKRRRWHTHDGAELLLLFDGEMTYVFRDGRTATLTGGKMLFVPAGIEHRSDISFVSSSYRVTLQMAADRQTGGGADDRLIRESMNLIGARPLEAVTIPPDALVCAQKLFDVVSRHGAPLPSVAAFHAIEDERAVAFPDFPVPLRELAPVVRLNLRSAVSLFISELALGLGDTQGKTFREVVVERVVKWIDAHHEEPFSIDKLVKVANCSRTYRFSAFRQVTGLSPNEVWIKRQIVLAEQLLRPSADAPALSIAQIAARLGFSSSQYFATVFKKYTGRTPSAWMKAECMK